MESPSQVLEQVLYPVVRELAGSNPVWKDVPCTPEAVLMGEGSPLNSIAVVTFIVQVEGQIHTMTGQAVSLATEKAFSRSRSPFRTLDSLATYIVEVLADTPTATGAAHA
jgi:hypothetical protein